MGIYGRFRAYRLFAILPDISAHMRPIYIMSTGAAAIVGFFRFLLIYKHFSDLDDFANAATRRRFGQFCPYRKVKIMAKTAFATATFKDIWAGNVAAELREFKTTRRGQRVTRFRWQRVDGMHCDSRAFQTISGAIAALARDARFCDVVAA